MTSGPVAHRRLPGEFKGFNAQQSTILVDGVINIGQVLQRGSLSNSTKFVVYGAVADADPSVVGAQIGNGNATQVSANSRADQHLGASGGTQVYLFALVKDSLGGVFVVLLMNLLGSKSPHEDRLSVPDNLQDLSWW